MYGKSLLVSFEKWWVTFDNRDRPLMTVDQSLLRVDGSLLTIMTELLHQVIGHF